MAPMKFSLAASPTHPRCSPRPNRIVCVLDHRRGKQCPCRRGRFQPGFHICRRAWRRVGCSPSVFQFRDLSNFSTRDCSWGSPRPGSGRSKYVRRKWGRQANKGCGRIGWPRRGLLAAIGQGTRRRCCAKLFVRCQFDERDGPEIGAVPAVFDRGRLAQANGLPPIAAGFLRHRLVGRLWRSRLFPEQYLETLARLQFAAPIPGEIALSIPLDGDSGNGCQQDG